jgi:hypothetical protein
MFARVRSFPCCQACFYTSIISVCAPANRTSLRVPAPVRIQRSGWFTSLSLRCGVPVCLSPGLMHCPMSHSPFPAQITAQHPDGSVEQFTRPRPTLTALWLSVCHSPDHLSIGFTRLDLNHTLSLSVEVATWSRLLQCALPPSIGLVAQRYRVRLHSLHGSI